MAILSALAVISSMAVAVGSPAAPPDRGAGPGKGVKLHSAVLIHEERGGPNNLLVIRTTGGHEASGDEVYANADAPFQAKATEEASPNGLSNWVISPRSSRGRGADLLRALRQDLRKKGVARFWGVFKPGGGDVGNVAMFRIKAYRDPAPARY